MNYVGRDQLGNTFFLKRHPRKELLEQLGRRHAAKMYVDHGAESRHIGYVIGQHWIEVHKLVPAFEG